MDNDIILNKKNITYATVSIAVYFSVGLTFYTQYEDISFLNSFYLITLTLTTVGYGNTVPTSSGGKLFTIFFVLIGIGFIALALGILSDYFASKHEKMMIKLLKSGEKPEDESCKSYKQILIDSAILILIFLTVILFYTLYEDLSIIDAVYMACISLTTIGFGDIVPETDGGKIFAIFWIFGGTLFVAKFIADYFEYFVDIRQQKIYDNIINSAIVNYDDLLKFSNNSGSVTRFEFLSGVLVKIGSVNKAKIQQIMKQFDKLDADDSGTLDLQDFKTNFPDYSEVMHLDEITEEKEEEFQEIV